MYVEIKTNDTAELERAFAGAIKKGQRAMLTLRKDGDYFSLSINDSLGYEWELSKQRVGSQVDCTSDQGKRDTLAA